MTIRQIRGAWAAGEATTRIEHLRSAGGASKMQADALESLRSLSQEILSDKFTELAQKSAEAQKPDPKLEDIQIGGRPIRIKGSAHRDGDRLRLRLSASDIGFDSAGLTNRYGINRNIFDAEAVPAVQEVTATLQMPDLPNLSLTIGPRDASTEDNWMLREIEEIAADLQMAGLSDLPVPSPTAAQDEYAGGNWLLQLKAEIKIDLSEG